MACWLGAPSWTTGTPLQPVLGGAAQEPGTGIQTSRFLASTGEVFHLICSINDLDHAQTLGDLNPSGTGAGSGEQPRGYSGRSLHAHHATLQHGLLSSCPSKSSFWAPFPSVSRWTCTWGRGPMRGSPGHRPLLEVVKQCHQRTPEPGFGPGPTDTCPGPSCTQLHRVLVLESPTMRN